MTFVHRVTRLLLRINYQFLIWFLAALVFAAVWLHTGRLISDDRANDLATAEKGIGNVARLMQEHADRTFFSADQTLQHFLGEYRRHGGKIDLVAVAEEGHFDPRILISVDILDRHGYLQQSSLPFDGQIDLSDRDYFQAHRSDPRDLLVISKPLRGRASGTWVIQLSRRFSKPNGDFDGVVVVSVDADYFTAFYSELKIGPNGVAALYDLEGNLFARHTLRKNSFVGNAAPEPVFARARQGELDGTMTFTSATDGMERIYRFAKLPSYRLLVLVGRATQDVLAGQQTMRQQRIIEAIFLSVMLLVLSLLLSWSSVLRKRYLRSQRNALLRLQNLTDHVPGLVYQYLLRSDGSACLPFASAGIRDIYRLNAQAVSQDATPIWALIHPEDLSGVQLSMRESVRTLSAWTCEYRVRYDDGTLVWLSGNALPQKRPDGSVLWHGFVMDVTQRKATEAEVERLAYYDVVTGLPNRRLLMDRLSRALATRASKQHQGHSALLFVDLDNFKNLNDTRGHQLGDELLQQVAQRLTACVAPRDTVARLGGDDFVVMLAELSDETTTADRQVAEIGEKILSSLRRPYQLGDFTHQGSASIGVALFNAQHASVEELFKHADMALYKAKDSGRNTLRFFDHQMQTVLNERIELEAALRVGLALKQFLLYYQPQVDQQGQLVGVEALLRWQHPQRGLVSPAEFIALAEETRLILPLGQWALESACQQLQQWSLEPERAHLTIAVNVSSIQFQLESFVSDVLATLDRSGAPAARLKLELTESVLVQDVEGIVAKMLALKAHGVGFSLDDFGTGYSSLAYLKRLPLDQVKIDQSFVSDALSSTKDAALVRTTVAMAHGLEMTVIAEGVETQTQCDFLNSVGCHYFQGYLFGRPVPVQELEHFFQHE